MKRVNNNGTMKIPEWMTRALLIALAVISWWFYTDLNSRLRSQELQAASFNSGEMLKQLSEIRASQHQMELDLAVLKSNFKEHLSIGRPEGGPP